MIYRIYGLLGACICLLSFVVSNAQNDVKVEKYDAKKALSINPHIRDYSQLPIKPARTISFTTDEASYIDLDISPDNKTIVFAFLGQLFTTSISGGKATQITSGNGINRFPVWASDGKKIFYKSDATGFVRWYELNTQGLFHRVIDLKSKQHRSRLASNLNDSLIKYEDISTAINRLVELGKSEAEVEKVKYSPDRRWISYIKSTYKKPINQLFGRSLDSLMIVDAKSGKEKTLAKLKIPFASGAYENCYTFSPDGKYIFIGYNGKIHRIEIATGESIIIPFIALVKIETSSLLYRHFPISLNPLEVKYIRGAKRSPDGKQLVFSALNKVYVMDIFTRKIKLLADQSVNQYQPVYSPDGKWIAYVTWKDGEGGHVWRVRVVDGVPEQVTNEPGLYCNPSWSPDGTQIIYTKGDKKQGFRDSLGKGLIQLKNFKNNDIIQLADDIPLFNNPMFPTTGHSVIYSCEAEGNQDSSLPRLLSKNVSTGLIDTMACARKKGESFRQMMLSPDKRYFAFTYNDNIFLAKVDNSEKPFVFFDERNNLPLIRFAKGGIDPTWEDGGNVLSWVNGHQYCRIVPERIIEAAKNISANVTIPELEKTTIIDVDITPDEVVTVDLRVPKQYNENAIALTNARIITMQNQKVIKDGVILIKNGRMEQIGKTNTIVVPKEATVYDCHGKTIIPGLIDMHSHMYGAVPPDVFNSQPWEHLINLAFGVTTVRDPSGSYDTFGYSELIETGQIEGPRLFTVGRAVRSFYNLNSYHEAEVIVNNRVKMGATVIKQYTQPTRLQRQLLLQACQKAGVNMTNEGDKNPLVTIGMIKDGSTGVEHNPIWGDIGKDVTTFLAKSGTYITPTLQACYGRVEGKYYFRKKYGEKYLKQYTHLIPENYQQEMMPKNKDDIDSSFLDQARNSAKIKKAGGRIVMGSHGEDQGIGAHYEIWALQMGGLTNYEALETATITAAEGLGMQKDLGSIEKGKIADLIILNSNPLDDIRNTADIQFVMKAGILYDPKALTMNHEKAN